MDALDCIAKLESSDRSEIIRTAIRAYLVKHPQIETIRFSDSGRKMASRLRDRLHLAIGLKTAEAIQKKNSICEEPKFDIADILEV